MKVRDSFTVAPRVRTRLPSRRYDSRIAIHGLHAVLAIPSGFDREFGLHSSYASGRPISIAGFALEQ